MEIVILVSGSGVGGFGSVSDELVDCNIMIVLC